MNGYIHTVQAHKRDLRYPTHHILTWYSRNFLKEPNPMTDLGCTLEDRVRVMDYALAIELIQFNRNESMVTEGGLVSTVGIQDLMRVYSKSTFTFENERA